MVMLRISKPPEETPFFKTKPIPDPEIAPPKIAQIIGSWVITVCGTICINNEVKVTVMKVKIVNFLPIFFHAIKNNGTFNRYNVMETGTLKPTIFVERVVKICAKPVKPLE